MLPDPGRTPDRRLFSPGRRRAHDRRLGPPGYRGYLNDRCVTIAEALHPAGYATLMTGKWHVGMDPDKWPLHRGFDHFYGSPVGGFYFNAGNKKVVEDDLVLYDALTMRHRAGTAPTPGPTTASSSSMGRWHKRSHSSSTSPTTPPIFRYRRRPMRSPGFAGSTKWVGTPCVRLATPRRNSLGLSILPRRCAAPADRQSLGIGFAQRAGSL